MRSHFVCLLLCSLTVVGCFRQGDEIVGQIKNLGTQNAESADGESVGKAERGSFPETSSFGNSNQNKFSERSTIGRPVGETNQFLNNREQGSSRPTGGFGQSSNNQHSSGRPTGGSNTIHRENENRPSGSRPSSTGDNSFGRPTGGITDHREGENRPSVSRPSNTGDSSFGRPTGGITDHREGESRPSGSRPSNTGDSSFGRPTGGITDHREGENRPSGSRPSNTGGTSFGRPTGGITDHRENENRPSVSRPTSTGDNSFGRPTGGITDHREGENRPSGSRPSNTGGSSFGRPTGGITDHRENENRPGITNQQQTGFRPDNQEHSGGQQHFGGQNAGQNQFTNGPNTENVSNIGGEPEKTEKEEEKDVCFPALGCFKMGKPWKTALRPIGAPHGPERIQTTIHFYSRDNLEKQRNITLYPEINMGEARFDPSKITAMIIHGFSNSGNATWMKDMKNVYLKKVDANVMIVDWGKGAQLFNYFQVAGNTRVVGKQLGVFIKHLIEKYGADPGKFHLIGHSLGAQISSYVGKEVQGIARLTALDPAQPAFEGFDSEIRLDKNDAEFVDVIHTDARPFIPTLGFGMITPHGHVDFYMNGGFDQPGCVPPPKKEIPSIKNVLDLAKFPVEVIAKTVACPHARAYEYLTEAFNETENCIFWGHKADVKNVFKSVTNTLTQGLLKKFTALSPTCSKEDCIPLGFATKKSPLRGVFVVTTNSRMPFCISEPGIPPETAPQERKRESFIQKIGKKVRGAN